MLPYCSFLCRHVVRSIGPMFVTPEYADRQRYVLPYFDAVKNDYGVPIYFLNDEALLNILLLE